MKVKLSIALDEGLAAALDAASQSSGLKRSTLIEKLLCHALGMTDPADPDAQARVVAFMSDALDRLGTNEVRRGKARS